MQAGATIDQGLADQGPAIQWEPRRLVSLEAARRHSRVVAWLRLTLVAGGLVAGAALIGSLVLAGLRGPDGRGVGAVEADRTVRMINPRFTSRNIAGAVMEVTAQSAARRIGDPDLIDLTAPVLISEDGVRVEAAAGVYSTESEAVELMGAVRFADLSGYSFESDRASMQLSENRVVGRSPVRGAGPLGQLRADSYEILAGGDVLILRGNVRATLQGNR